MIKIGLLLDDGFVSKWISELVEYIQSDDRFELSFVVLNKAPETKTRSSFLYRVLRRVDTKLMALPGNPFQKVPLNLKGIPIIDVFPVQKKFSDYFPDTAICSIQNEQPDLLIRFGFRILRGKILTVPRYGILSLHHGDTAAYRGGPPAFWEVVERSPVTGVTLQVLTEALDAGVILDKVFIRTDFTSFHRNQHKLYKAGQQLVKKQLQLLAKEGCVVYFTNRRQMQVPETKGKLYRNPGNLQCVFLFLSFFKNTLARQVRSLFFIDQWQLAYCIGEEFRLPLPVRGWKTLVPPKDRIWADPFPVYQDGVYHIFLEEKFFNRPNGHIAVLRMNQQGTLLDTEPVPVLQTSFHLSYPFVFEKDGVYYMIPESGAAKQVLLYEAVSFPFQWKLKKVLLDGVAAFDSTLHFHTDGTCYLFCTVQYEDNSSADAFLHIYLSVDWLQDPFVPHQLNPVQQDVRHARPGGALVRSNDLLLRPAQICAPLYGYGLSVQVVQELSPASFSEKSNGELLPSLFPEARAIHTINHAGKFLVADKQVRRFRWMLLAVFYFSSYSYSL